MAEGIYEIATGTNIDSKARYNYAQWCNPKGTGLIPAQYRVPGAAIFWSDSGASSIHHVAYLWKPVKEGHPEGDWYIIEAKGVAHGVVSGKLYSRKPNFWGWMTKYYDYGQEAAAPVQNRQLGNRLLYNGCEGEDVKELQIDLLRLGYDLGKWGADGDFGDATEIAVRAFQKDHNLEVDGKFGAKSLAELDAALAESEKPIEVKPKFVKIEGGNCYVRTESSTVGRALGVAYAGDKLPYGGETAQNGWLKVIYKEQMAWVSGKYGKLVEE